MDRESVERLRFDRRLQRRPDWVKDTEARSNIDALPDVSDKMTTAAELEAEEARVAEAAEAAAQAAPPAPEPSFGAPAPVAGEFSSTPSYASPESSEAPAPVQPAGSFGGGFGNDSGEPQGS
jgi:hypothetical protein